MENVATGVNALKNNENGYYNTANGFASLSDNILGTGNTAMGYQSLNKNLFGDYNLALGYNALFNAARVSKSTAIGAYSQEKVGADNIPIDNANVSVGYESIRGGDLVLTVNAELLILQ
jgi:hypothetical protein